MSTLKIVANDAIVASDRPLPVTIIGGVPASAIINASGVFANTALSNLSSVGVNTSLVPATHDTSDIGSTSKMWDNGYFTNIIVNQNTASALPSLAGTAFSARGADNAQVRIGYSSYGVGGVGAFAGRHARGTAASPSAVQNGDFLFGIEGWGYGATGYSVAPSAMIRGLATGAWTDASQPAKINFWTTPTGTIVPAIRMIIKEDGNVQFYNNTLMLDSMYSYFGTGNDMAIYYDGTSGYINSSLVAPSDININCGTDKTVVLTETVWDDVLPYSLNPGTGLTALTIADYGSTGFRMNQFSNNTAANEEIQCYFQLPHSYKQGTNLHLHLHVVPSANGATGASAVEFNLAWQWVNIGSAYSSASNTTANTTFTVGSADQGKHTLWEFTELSGTGKTLSSDVMVKIKRLTKTADRVNDNYLNSVWLRFVDIHFEKDTIGSRQELAK